MRFALLTPLLLAANALAPLSSAEPALSPARGGVEAPAPPPALAVLRPEALDPDVPWRAGAQEWGLEAGYSSNHNVPYGQVTGIAMEFVTVRAGHLTSPRQEVGLEATAGHVQYGGGFSVLGLTGTYRRYVSQRPDHALFADLDFGLLQFGGHIPQLATRTNFQTLVGFGAQFPTSDQSALVVEYRFQHVSNAGRAYPDIGLNSSQIVVGYSIFR